MTCSDNREITFRCLTQRITKEFECSECRCYTMSHFMAQVQIITGYFYDTPGPPGITYQAGT